MRLITAITVSALALVSLSVGPASAVDGPTPTPRSLILNAFGDAEGTFGESQPFITRLTNAVDRTADSAFCDVVVEGDLYGQPVAVVVTGTGGGNSGPCTQEVLGWYSPAVTEVIWSGIGGATPAMGGMYDAAGRRLANPPVMIGDVCIGAASWSWDLHFSNVNDWAASNPPPDRYSPDGGWWAMVDAQGKQVVPGFGGVQQRVVADTRLASQLQAAAAAVDLPRRPASVSEKIARFHPDRRKWRAPLYFPYTRCGGEVSGDNFWHGATEDRLARQYMARLMRASGLNTRATAGSIVAFSAMEAVPWMSAVQRWNRAKGTAIPMAVIRAASNYDQIPLQSNGDPVLGKSGRPLTAEQDLLLGFDDDSSAYAAATAAAPVLSLFRQRAAG